jgi:hypothetical protein
MIDNPLVNARLKWMIDPGFVMTICYTIVSRDGAAGQPMHGGWFYGAGHTARDWGNLYGAGDGTIRVDSDGIYRHIGVATCPRRVKDRSRKQAADKIELAILYFP